MAYVLLSDLKNSGPSPHDLKAWASTDLFRHKLRYASELIRNWLAACSRPYVSCGCGKDSMATALLVRAECSTVPIVCAHPPNPMPDREQHVNAARKYLGEPWIDVDYPWNVEAVLDRREAYPHLLKITVLNEIAARYKFDGLAMGLRTEESAGRRILAAVYGDHYQKKDGIKVCLPVMRWRAEETLGLAASLGAPIHPVYSKIHLMPSYEVLRDGTWWPHGMLTRGYRNWLAWHYPAMTENYDRAIIVTQVDGY